MTKNGGASNRRGGFLGRLVDARPLFTLPPDRGLLVSRASAGSHSQILLYYYEYVMCKKGVQRHIHFHLSQLTPSSVNSRSATQELPLPPVKPEFFLRRRVTPGLYQLI